MKHRATMQQLAQFLSFLGIFLYWLTTAGIAIRLMTKRRPIGVTLAWLLVMFVVPVIGILAYLLVGEPSFSRARQQRYQQNLLPYQEWLWQLQRQQPLTQQTQLSQVMQLGHARLNLPVFDEQQLQLLSESEQFFIRLSQDILQAQHSIHLTFYIWHLGGEADQIAEALIRAAYRGVEVQLLLDSSGSRHFLQSHWSKRFTQAGIKLCQALPVSPLSFLRQRIDLRLHRKLIVIDNRIAYTGSMNLVDPKCFKQELGIGQWVDIMVRLEGMNAATLNSIHAWDWAAETGQMRLPDLDSHQPEDQQQLKQQVTSQQSLTQVLPSGPDMPAGLIHQVLLQAIANSKKSIYITTPYFIPSDHLLFALISAAQRRVQVHLIIPAKNDSFMVEWASRSFFGELLRAGVNIYCFQGGLLHTKSIVVDQQLCLLGTVNLDMRSLWLNLEITLMIDSQSFAQQLTQELTRYIHRSQPILLSQWQQRTVFHRFIEQFFYWFSPLL